MQQREKDPSSSLSRPSDSKPTAVEAPAASSWRAGKAFRQRAYSDPQRSPNAGQTPRRKHSSSYPQSRPNQPQSNRRQSLSGPREQWTRESESGRNSNKYSAPERNSASKSSINAKEGDNIKIGNMKSKVKVVDNSAQVTNNMFITCVIVADPHLGDLRFDMPRDNLVQALKTRPEVAKAYGLPHRFAVVSAAGEKYDSPIKLGYLAKEGSPQETCPLRFQQLSFGISSASIPHGSSSFDRPIVRVPCPSPAKGMRRAYLVCLDTCTFVSFGNFLKELKPRNVSFLLTPTVLDEINRMIPEWLTLVPCPFSEERYRHFWPQYFNQVMEGRPIPKLHPLRKKMDTFPIFEVYEAEMRLLGASDNDYRDYKIIVQASYVQTFHKASDQGYESEPKVYLVTENQFVLRSYTKANSLLSFLPEAFGIHDLVPIRSCAQFIGQLLADGDEAAEELHRLLASSRSSSE